MRYARFLRRAGFGVAAIFGAAADAQTNNTVTQGEAAMGAPIVFFDIAGPDSPQLTSFYSTVFGWDIGGDGSVTVDVTAPLRGTFRTEANNESLLYFAVTDVTATLEQIAANGGAISQPRFEVPGVVVLGLFHDPAGNRMGLVEVDEDGKVVVP